MIYFEQGGWWLPDGEEHLQQWMNTVNHRQSGPGGELRLTYQYHKYAAALPYVRRHRLAVDVGAHVGLWSWVLARDFERIICFEPMLEHQQCWKKNLSLAPNAQLLPFALGAKIAQAHIRTRTPGSSGDTGIDPVAERSSLRATIQPEGELIKVRPLDDFELTNIDLIKIDCEGYELFVLQGAVETLKRNKPCLIVEQKPETGMKERYGVTAADCLAYLRGLGAIQRAAIQGDYIFSWG